MAEQGRKVGSRVKLTPYAWRLYPQFAGKVGRITKREVLTRGHGLLARAYHSYRIAYFVRFAGESKDYFLSAQHLTGA